MEVYGYARVSTKEQNLQLQVDALNKYGCTIIYQEKASTRGERPKFKELLNKIKEGDTLVIYKLDRLGRSLKEIIMTFDKVGGLGANIVSLKDAIDTSTAVGRLMFHMVSSFAEFERDLIRERTIAGLKASKKKKGRVFRYDKRWVRHETRKGTPKEQIMNNPKFSIKQIELLRDVYKHSEQDILEAEKQSVMSKATYYRIIKG